MNKEDAKRIIKELRINRSVLNELEAKAHSYRNQGIEHNLDGNVLFELGLLQEKLTTILYIFYLGDIEKDCRKRRISSKERSELINSRVGKATHESPPFFNFGYMNSEFIDVLEELD